MARWYFLACFILTDSLVAGQSTRYELSGQKVSLKPNIPGTPESILWKRNGNKVVEFNGQEQEAYGQYINRVSVDWHTAELEITDLRFEDSGEYELEVYMNKKISTSFHKLEVIDRVAKPTISCEMNDGGGSKKSGTLLCSAEPRQPQSLMMFEWRSNGNVQSGTKLTISLGDEYDDEVYSCSVSNPLSNETATFTAKDCYPGNDSVLIGVLVAIAVLSLLIVGLAIICCKQHNKACFAKGNRHDPEKRGATKGSDEGTADERRGFIDRTPTIPSTQRLIQEDDGDLQDEKPKKGTVRNKIKQFESNFPGEAPPIKFPADSKRNKDKNKNHLANNNRGDADEDQLRESAETKVPPCGNTPEPAAELTNMISSTAAEQSDEETGSPASSPRSESQSLLDPSNPARNDKGDADADQLSEPAETEVQHHDSSDSERENETKPADVSTNMMSDRESSTASEHQDLEKNRDEETGSPASSPRSESQSPLDPSNPARSDKGDADADQLSEPADEVLSHRDSSDSEEENEPKPADVSTNTMSDLEPSTVSEHQEKGEEGKSPVPKPRSQFAGGQKEDADSDQVNEVTDTSGVGETIESGASSEDEQFSPVSEQKDSEMTRHDQDPDLSQSETHTSEDNQQEMDKPVPAAEKESGSEGNSEEPDLYSASSHQPQSSTPTKPDNRSNDAFKGSPDAAHDEPGQGGEGKTTRDSDESGESEDDTGEDKK